MEKVGWLVMQYKLFRTNVLWSLKNGLAIWLWKEDGIKRLKPLMKFPNLVPFCSIWGNDEMKASEKERFISREISKYIKFWKLEMLKDDSYSRVMGLYVK